MARDVKLGVTLTVDREGFRAAMRGSRKDLDDLVDSADRAAREADDLGESLGRTGKEADDLGGSFDRGARASDRNARAQKRAERQTKRTAAAFLEAHRHHLKYIGGLASGAALVQFARHINQSGAALERVEQRFASATDTSAEAADEMSFFRAEADRLRLGIESLQSPYSGFLVALKDTELRGQPAREIFTAIGVAARVLSLDGEDLRGVFTALEQIVSKGTVSAEELRGQLGERLPGAFQAAARAMGVTEGELDDMLRKGELAAVDLLPALAAELQRAFGPSLADALETNTAELDAFGNEALRLREALAAAGLLELEAGLKSGLAPAMRLVADHAGLLVGAFKAAGAAGGVALALLAARAAAAALASRGLSVAAAALAATLNYQAAAAGRTTAAMGVMAGSFAVARAGAAALWTALGPIGAVSLAAGAAVALLSRRSREARPDLVALADGVDAYREAAARLSRTELLNERDALRAGIADAAREAEAAGRSLERGSGPGAHAVPFRGDQIERLEARRADALASMRAQGAELREIQRLIDGVVGDGDAGGPEKAGIGDHALAILDGLIPEDEQIRARANAAIATLEAERERLLDAGGYSAEDVNRLSAGIVALREQLAEAARGPADDDAEREVESIRAAAAARFAATEEGILAEYARKRRLIQAEAGADAALLAEIESQRDAALGEIHARRAARAEAAAEAEAEALRRSGQPDLDELRAGSEAIRQIEGYSRESLAQLNAERELELELKRAYPDATAETLAALAEEHAERARLLRQRELEIDLVERYNPPAADTAERQEALNRLFADGALSAGQYARALADIRIEAGEGSFADGLIAELERVREESRGAAADVGTSFARVFGPDGQLTRGLGDSIGRMVAFGESSRETFEGVAKQAVAGFVSELVQVGIRWVLLNTLFRGSRAAASAGEVAHTTADAAATTFLAGQRAYASTAAIPIVGPALAPAAAAQALAAAGALGAGAVTAAAGKVAAFRYGGVVDDPVYFGFSGPGGRRIGVAGEAGAEGIFPLARSPDGNLGVRAVGGRSRDVTVNLNIQATDAEGFDGLLRRRRGMIAGLVREALDEDGRY